MDRPLAIFRDGKLWLDQGMGSYEPTDRFRVTLMREHFLQRTRETATRGPLSARYAAECQAALNQYEQHEREKA